MNKKSGQRTPISKRLFALLLCCVCLLGVMPLAAIATRAAETQPVTIAQTTATEAATEAATEGVMAAAETEPTGTEPGDTLPTETEAEETVPSGTEAEQETEAAETTEPSTEPSDPTETTAPAETVETVDPVKALYDSLMECTTLEQVNAVLNPATEEEQAAIEALIAQFTEEQNAALSAKMAELGAYDTDVLVEYSGTITVSNTIETDGCLTVTSPVDTESKKYTFKWEVQDGSSWVEVKREKKSGDNYNITDNGRSINVALDGGAQKTYRASVATINGEAVTSSSNSAATKVDYYSELRNGSFETPVVSEWQTFVEQGTSELVWKTTDTDRQVEILNTNLDQGRAYNWHGVLAAYDGVQCAEINANYTSALYQDVLTTPGSTMHWSLAHLARSMNGKKVNNGSGTDSMYVLIMPTELAKNITTQTQVENVRNNISQYPGAKIIDISYTWKWEHETTGSGRDKVTTYTMYRQDGSDWTPVYQYTNRDAPDNNTKIGNLTTPNNPWKVTQGDYEVPEDQYLTRYFFVANNTGSEVKSVGNHIDRVWFSTELPPANPGSISLTIQKTINVDGWADLTPEQQDDFKDSISFTTNLSSDAISGSQMTWNGNVGTYNIQNYSIGTAGNKEVTVTETTTAVDGYELTSDKTSWTGTVVDGDVGKAEFTNTYTPSNVTLTIKKLISGNMLSKNDKFQFTVTGNSVAEADRTFELKGGEEKTITVQKGDTITIKEAAGNYTTTVEGGTLEDGQVTITNIAEDTTITFTNTKEVTIDTGISLETLPYILILAVVAVGAVVMIRKRRNRDED